MVLTNFGKNLVMQNFFCVVYRKMYTPVNPSFTNKSRVRKGYKLHVRVTMMKTQVTNLFIYHFFFFNSFNIL